MLYGSEYVFHPGNRDTGNDITLDRNQIIQGELQILQSPALAAEVLQAVGPTTDCGLHDDRTRVSGTQAGLLLLKAPAVRMSDSPGLEGVW